MNEKKVLAIDYGTQRVGLAVSYGSLAEPLKIVSNSPQLLNELQAIILEENIEQIVVGISENEMAAKTLAFIDQLKQVVSLPIETMDETLSSHAVHQKTLQGGMKQKDRQQPIDHLAAAEFLQEWLDEENSKL